jgi:hypothetical protein
MNKLELSNARTEELRSQRDQARRRADELADHLAVAVEGDEDYDYIKQQLLEKSAEVEDKERRLAKLESANQYFVQANQSIDTTLAPLLLSLDQNQYYEEGAIRDAMLDLSDRLSNWIDSFDSRFQIISGDDSNDK